MPLFEYECTACGNLYERLTKEPPQYIQCTKCGATAVRKISLPAKIGDIFNRGDDYWTEAEYKKALKD